MKYPRNRAHLETVAPQTFTKHDTGKAPLDFLLQFTGPLEQVCRIAKYGADKYNSLNWQKCESSSS